MFKPGLKLVCTCNLSVLFFIALISNSLVFSQDNIVTNWQYQPLLDFLLEQYAQTTGKSVPELSLSNNRAGGFSLKTPEGKDAFAVFAPIRPGIPDDLVATPIVNQGYFFFTHTKNPYLDQLAECEIPAATFKQIWRQGLSWEELLGVSQDNETSNTNHDLTPVEAIVASSVEFFSVFVGCQPQESQALKLQNRSGIIAVSNSPRALGVCDFSFVADNIINSDNPFPDSILPLRFIQLDNGNYQLKSYGTSGGKKTRWLQYDQFGGIAADGDFLQTPLILLTKNENATAFAQELAECANKIELDLLMRYQIYPVKFTPRQKQQPTKRFVYSHTMQCYIVGGIPTGFANSYDADSKTEDFVNWPQSGKLRTWWSERLTPLVDKVTPEAIKTNLDDAEKAGLDAHGFLIYPGVMSADNPWHKGLIMLLEAAQEHRVKVLFDLWNTFSPNWSADKRDHYFRAYAQYLRNLLDKYPQAFYYVDDKIVLNFGRDMTARGIYTSDYDTFFTELGGRDRFYLVATIQDSRASSTFFGWDSFTDSTAHWFVHSGWGDKMQQHLLLPVRELRNDPLTWGVSPGYFRIGGNVTEGYGACKLLDNWREAIEYNVGSVYVQSWNDLAEDHHILESNLRGDTFIQLNRYFADYFRTGQKPVIDKDRVFVFHHRQLVDAKITSPDRTATNPTWSSAPLSDYVHIVSMLTEPGDISVVLDKNRRFVHDDVPAGLYEWLILVSREKDHKDNKPYWNGDAYDVTHPQTTDYRWVTLTDSLTSCTPIVTVTRNDEIVATVQSRCDIAEELPYQTLNIVGTGSE